MSLEGIKKLVDGGQSWTNDRGNTVHSRTVYTIQDRYFFDGKMCTRALGFEQFDTEQDASYFGVWVNREERATVTYAEHAELALRFWLKHCQHPSGVWAIGEHGVWNFYTDKPMDDINIWIWNKLGYGNWIW